MNAALWAALAIDMALVFVALNTDGVAWSFGPVRFRLRSPSNPLIVAVFLVGALTAANWRHPRRRAWTLAAAVLVVVFAGVNLTRHAARVYPLSDIAVIELYARNALTGKLLVGPYSRFGWHHPGPAYFYLIAPVYALADRQPAALAAGAAALTLAAVAALAWLMARRFSSIMTAAVLASVTLFLWRLPDLVTSPWNPHVVIVPALALFAAGSVLATGDLLMLPVVALLASFIVQTDVALVPVAGAVAAASGVSGLLAVRRRGGLQEHSGVMMATAWVLAAVWFLTLAEQLTHSPGNMTLLWRFFVERPGSGQPLGVAVWAWAKMLAAPFQQLSLTMANTPERSLAIALLQLAAISTVGVWAAGRGLHTLAKLTLVSLLAAFVGLWSVTRIEERIVDHQVFWLSAIGVLNLGIIAGAAGQFLRNRLAGRLQVPSAAAPLVCGALIAVCVWTSFDQLERARAGYIPVTRTSPVAQRLAANIRDYLAESGVQRPLFRIGEGEPIWGMVAGVLLELDRAGIPFAVEESWMPMFPQAFAANGFEDAEIAASDAATHSAHAARPENVQVTSSDAVYFDAVPIRPVGGR